MKLRHSATCASVFAVALLASAAMPGAAQDTTRTDTTRRVTSQRRIPVSKEGTRRSSAGEVALRSDRAELDSALAAHRAELDAERARMEALSNQLNTLNGQLTSLTARVDADSRSIASLQDSIAATRRSLSDVTMRTVALSDTVHMLRTKIAQMRNRQVFGNGFYVGVGTGASLPNGQLHGIGYLNGLVVTVPIGYKPKNSMLGVQLDITGTTFDGRQNSALLGPIDNPNPEIYSGVLNLTLNFPLTDSKLTNFYVLGGGGAYYFKNFGTTSGLAQRILDAEDIGGNADAPSKTKWGVNGGAGLSIHMIYGTNLFVESRFTNVFAGNSNGSLRWVPITAGITLH